jgi:hypothetical protein
MAHYERRFTQGIDTQKAAQLGTAHANSGNLDKYFIFFEFRYDFLPNF